MLQIYEIWWPLVARLRTATKRTPLIKPFCVSERCRCAFVDRFMWV